MSAVLFRQQTPDLGIEPPEWTVAALCLQVDPDIFHVDKGGTVNPAKWVCSRCEVRADCLAYVMAIEDDVAGRFGIFGGLTPKERRGLADAGWCPDDVLPEINVRPHGGRPHRRGAA